MIRFGMCGCGFFIQKAVLPMLSRVNGARAVAAFDSNSEMLEMACTDFKIEHACGSFEELIGRDDVDVIYIASPNVFHKEQAKAAANAGKHVFCQKPMGMNAAECAEMLEACRIQEVKLGIGFCNRFQGAQLLARDMIAKGELGEVSHIHFSLNLAGFTKKTAGWRCDLKMSGGGPLMDLAPHLIDLGCYLLEDRVESVMAYIKHGRDDEDIETDAIVMMQFVKGAVITMDTSFTRWNEHNYSITGTGGEIRAKGTMSWFSGGTMTEFRNGKFRELEFSKEEQIQKELQLFCDALESGRQLPVPGEAGLHAQEVIDAIYESGRTGQRCSVKNYLL